MGEFHEHCAGCARQILNSGTAQTNYYWRLVAGPSGSGFTYPPACDCLLMMQRLPDAAHLLACIVDQLSGHATTTALLSIPQRDELSLGATTSAYDQAGLRARRFCLSSSFSCPHSTQHSHICTNSKTPSQTPHFFARLHLSFQKTENKTGFPFIVLKPASSSPVGSDGSFLFTACIRKNVLFAHSTSPLPQVLASQGTIHHHTSRAYLH